MIVYEVTTMVVVVVVVLVTVSMGAAMVVGGLADL